MNDNTLRCVIRSLGSVDRILRAQLISKGVRLICHEVISETINKLLNLSHDDFEFIELLVLFFKDANKFKTLMTSENELYRERLILLNEKINVLSLQDIYGFWDQCDNVVILDACFFWFDMYVTFEYSSIGGVYPNEECIDRVMSKVNDKISAISSHLNVLRILSNNALRYRSLKKKVDDTFSCAIMFYISDY